MKITFYMWASYCSILKRAVEELKKEGVSLNYKIYSNRFPINEKFFEDVVNSDVVLIYKTSSDDIDLNKLKKLNKNIIIVSQDVNVWNSEKSHKCYLYMTYGGLENFKNMVLYLMGEEKDVKKQPLQGIYYDGKIYDELIEFLNDVEFKKKHTVGILFSRHYLINEDMDVILKLIEKLKQHFNVIPVFTYGAKCEELNALGGGESVLKYFFKDGKPIIDALINMLSFPLGTIKDGSHLNKLDGVDLLKKLNVPVFHPIISYYKSYNDWKEDKQGLSADIGWTIALPEFEGVIEPIIIGTTENEGFIEKKFGIDERIEKFVERVKRWIDLKYKPKKERKIVFILHSSACSSVEATIGSAAHLDALQSVVNIMKKLKEEGYFVEEIPEDGEGLIKHILQKKAISEFRWTTVNEIVARGGYLYLMDEGEYMEYFNSLPKSVKEKIIKTWGDLNENNSQGMIYKVNEKNKIKNKIVITGLKFGNIYVCVQPKRGCIGARCDGKVCKILHDPHCPPTHHYIATYKYFNDIADVIIHVGTHGSLEFLPGKNVGLSNECYPDICIGTIPHLYIYNSDNPAEGTIAKRRSYATIIDHMQTVMKEAFYDDLETLDSYISEYLKNMDPSRRHQLEHLISEEIKRLNIPKIKGKIEEYEKEGKLHEKFEEIFKEIREIIELLKSSQYNDGMHVFGELPEGERRAEFIKCILKNLLADEDLKDELTKKTVLKVISGEKIKNKKLESKIKEINERIERSDEIRSLIKGLNAEYIEPGPSGLITKGNYEILPTGRNFYSIDPYNIPTKSAYKVGVLLAEKLLEKYLKEEGKYPESVAIYWMVSDIMWADGEGMGMIFHLLGVKPIYKGGKITGLEVIPLEELGRPRIDITIRVSGIIRDMFFNCVELVDEAIRMVANLDEPDEMNYIKKHVFQNLKEGLSFREATFRIFSSPPGTYGNGVKYAIYASAWKTEEDLKDAFIHWNAYAYGKNAYGKKATYPFTNMLKTVDLTFNKVITDEYDLLGCCCYFGTYGGLINAVKVLKGVDVKTYYGDTRDPNKLEVRTLKEEIERITISKLLNPRWIEGLKRHGYKGAGDISKRVGRVYGWSATTGEVEDWIFEEIFNTYIKNEDNRNFFKEHNIYALEEMTRRLLEAIERGLWNADKKIIDELKRVYMEIEGEIEDEYENLDIGSFQGGSIDIDLSWKEKI
ncbi:Magnesium chelatase [Methanocaldococcus vulcanius M7]|uniref:Magnesium chelatase n=1 Tax=Methanocaldococcus vulcanius (strain ATCC 700851 / DSM 12094 / M7) TaxID=579137 RepID=C9RHR7_METVM|nr:cobaltochelatase subunit CobN [Methanocaldococcus vulcanius]ACX73119.1 Magnesium chelatase [Methanocaldococcus vulcanius M7]